MSKKSNNNYPSVIDHIQEVLHSPNIIQMNCMSTHNASRFYRAKEVINSCSETNCKVNTFYDSIEMGIFSFSMCPECFCPRLVCTPT